MQPGYEGENYLPHLTMLRGVPAAELDAVRAALTGAHPSATFTVRSVALECHLPGQRWRARRTFPLGPRQRRLAAAP